MKDLHLSLELVGHIDNDVKELYKAKMDELCISSDVNFLEKFFAQIEQWNDEDEYTRCIQALNAIPEDWRNYRIAYDLYIDH